MVSNGTYGSLFVHTDSNGSLLVLMSLLVHMGPYAFFCFFLGFLLVLMRPDGSICFLMRFHSSFWVLMGPYKSLCVLMCPYASLWFLMRPYGFQSFLIRPYRCLFVFVDSNGS